MRKCPRCQTLCEGEFCQKCGAKTVLSDFQHTEYGINSELIRLNNTVKSLKNLCVVLLWSVIILTVLFIFAYWSVWENIVDLWENAEDLWKNADMLWESSESLWNGWYYYYRY